MGSDGQDVESVDWDRVNAAFRAAGEAQARERTIDSEVVISRRHSSASCSPSAHGRSSSGVATVMALVLADGRLFDEIFLSQPVRDEPASTR